MIVGCYVLDTSEGYRFLVCKIEGELQGKTVDLQVMASHPILKSGSHIVYKGDVAWLMLTGYDGESASNGDSSI